MCQCLIGIKLPRLPLFMSAAPLPTKPNKSSEDRANYSALFLSCLVSHLSTCISSSYSHRHLMAKARRKQSPIPPVSQIHLAIHKVLRHELISLPVSSQSPHFSSVLPHDKDEDVEAYDGPEDKLVGSPIGALEEHGQKVGITAPALSAASGGAEMMPPWERRV